MKTVSVIGLFAIMVSAGCSGSRTLPAASAAATRAALSSNRWIFTARQMMPQYGSSRQVNGVYNIVLKDSSCVVYLPYRGRANAGADVLSGKGPLDFASRDFAISTTDTSGGKWQLSIKPNDNREVQSLFVTCFGNGSATVNIQLTNHSGISFNGMIAPLVGK